MHGAAGRAAGATSHRPSAGGAAAPPRDGRAAPRWPRRPKMAAPSSGLRLSGHRSVGRNKRRGGRARWPRRCVVPGRHGSPAAGWPPHKGPCARAGFALSAARRRWRPGGRVGARPAAARGVPAAGSAPPDRGLPSAGAGSRVGLTGKCGSDGEG